MREFTILGVDLAASPRRPTGTCLLAGLKATTELLFSNDDIMVAAKEDVRLISIDAPLSLPAGRCCLRTDCRCAGAGHFRNCDLEVRRLGIKILPLTIGAMRLLTERGILLRREFERKGIEVIETFPHGAKRIWGCSGKGNVDRVVRALKEFGIKGDIEKKNLSQHEIDAIICALVGRYYLLNDFFAAGNPLEGQIILPKK